VRLSIVVPCYNEQDSLRELHDRLTAVAQAAVGEQFELVFVNDGSSDDSWSMMCSFASRDEHVVAIDLSKRHGHQLALSAGLSVCQGERVLLIDADLQDPPELLGEMMRLMDEGASVVYGEREQRAGESIFKRVSAWIFYRLLHRLTDVPIPPDTGDFRLLSAHVVQVLNRMPEQHRFVRGMVSWAGFKQVALPYVRCARAGGTSNYSFGTMLRLALDAITGFSIRPLRIASVIGLVSAFLGLVGVVLTLIDWLGGKTVQGWASVMVVILVLGGLQLVMIGILGEYLGRLYIEAKRRPLYIVSDIRRGKPGAGVSVSTHSGLE
jgi:glycosyltransferase involved in cell wall biosynthesis